jgi:hypothetical protein
MTASVATIDPATCPPPPLLPLPLSSSESKPAQQSPADRTVNWLLLRLPRFCGSQSSRRVMMQPRDAAVCLAAEHCPRDMKSEFCSIRVKRPRFSMLQRGLHAHGRRRGGSIGLSLLCPAQPSHNRDVDETCGPIRTDCLSRTASALSCATTSPFENMHSGGNADIGEEEGGDRGGGQEGVR